MVEALLSLLAFLVFGVLWLSSQSWFDILPRRVTRRIGYAGLAVLAGTVYFAPSAFQSGVERWIDYAVDRVQEKYADVMTAWLDDIGPKSPEPSPVPSPTEVPQRP